MNKSKTCGNCGNNTKDDVCMIWDTGLKVTEAGTCTGWQPIPVATTHAPHTDTTAYDPLRELDDMRHKMANMNDAMAKRDDLIRRMITELGLTDHPNCKCRQCVVVRSILSEANELMGVK